MRIPLSLAALLLFVTTRVAAEPARGADACAGPLRSTLTTVGCRLAAGLGERAQGALVIGVTPTADPPVAVRAELASRLARLVAGSIGSGATAWPAVLGAARARALSDGRRPLVVVTARLGDARLEVTADAFVGRDTLWRRLRRGRSGPVSHAFAEGPLDAELKTFLPPVPLVAREIIKGQGADADLVAVACGDLDGDGSPEIAALGRRRVSVLRLRGGRVETAAARPLTALAPVAGTPLREPIAAAWIPAKGALDLGVTDRAAALRLDAKLQSVTPLAGRLPWPGGGCANVAELGVAPKLEPCRPGEAAPGGEAPGAGAGDALAGARVTRRDGSVAVVRAVRLLGTSTASIRDGARTLTVEPVGAELAVGDLDGDGSAELVASLDTQKREEDAIVVYGFSADGQASERFRLPVPSGVRAVGVCPLRSSAMAPIVVATGDGLWLVR